MTTTELARELAVNPRFWAPASGSVLFNETAAVHGADFTGVAWMQALIGASQGVFTVLAAVEAEGAK